MAARFFTIALIVLATASASARQHAEPTVPAADYIVGPADVLIITSYDQDDLSGKFTVENDGTFTFPMVGRVTVGGKTLREVETSLKALLVERGFFKSPQLTVAVDQYRSQKIFVLGEVRKPGVYTLSGVMRLVEALALADSTLPTAGNEIVIMPAANDQSSTEHKEATRVDRDDLESGKLSANVTLHDGDTILIPRAENVYVFGQVKNPGAYPRHQDDMTVLQALSLAGGVTDRGSMGRIEILRVVAGAQQEIKAQLTDHVHANDTIIVPERYF